eukprot:Seg12181.1 transcript_id=Seg12181.1/GoldUCD/mRNA.D3Y31 product="hypothetical protein" protein_id=Seg12181.1/GoldUCD/D3Y31
MEKKVLYTPNTLKPVSPAKFCMKDELDQYANRLETPVNQAKKVEMTSNPNKAVQEALSVNRNEERKRSSHDQGGILKQVKATIINLRAARRAPERYSVYSVFAIEMY